MKYYNEFQYNVDEHAIRDLLESCKSGYPEHPDKETLMLIFSLIDLTSLSERDNAENIGRMCDQMNLLTESYPELPSPAAICVYPELVPIVRAKLSNPLVNIASVGAGFPSSQTFMEVKLREVELAVESGADEIDIVISVGKLQLGLFEEVFEEIKTIKDQLGPVHLKVILETGSLQDLTEVRRASFLAMDAGADFIKTSTGKAGKGASPDAFAVMCRAIREFYDKTGKKVGIKPAGGISDVPAAYEYLGIVRHILGKEWLDPEKFRIGASRLANNVIREIFEKDASFSYFD